MLNGWIKNLFSASRSGKSGSALSTLAPAERFYAVGDIHGRLDLLQRLIASLDADCPLVFVGDYIDRGECSAQVLRHLYHLSGVKDREVICLLGNHEDMLLQFLKNPEAMARMWWHNGGRQTLASFGVADGTETTDRLNEIGEALRREMGQPLLEWIQDRPLTWTSGNVTVVHAALDPHRSVDKQSRKVCLWGHPQFPGPRRKDGQWIVHGHTIVTDPTVENQVISIDTGAFATNHLTAAEISSGQVRFLSTDRNGVTQL
ncbi:metallophosphoesterase family protein [Ruegeria arenilitoris]|uniref:metallophosphoesterase family protein n=1 Tax=Ruegeria arenilitoris TaxID=1173585 RepID=UPI00147CFFF6|nr:metallophosphoesterase family protein [Ruegeria arenilitoris]